MRRHLRQFANFRLLTKLDSSRNITPKFYDWHITDVLNGGNLRANSATSTNPVGLLLSFSKAASGSGKPAGNAHYGLFDNTINTASLNNRLPDGAAIFLQSFVSNNKNDRSGKVTVEEIDKKGYKKIKIQKKTDLDN